MHEHINTDFSVMTENILEYLMTLYYKSVTLISWSIINGKIFKKKYKVK